MKPIIVQKFGGTSLASAESRKSVLAKVVKAREDGYKVVVVVSAMGRDGDPYATDTLLHLMDEINPVKEPKKNDLIMSCGEIISCALMAHYLETNGIEAEAMTGFQAGIMTDDNFNNSEVVEIYTEKINSVLQNGIVPVIAGFQGMTASGDITTLGRGGGDTAAVAIGGYLKAERVDIFTDVIGIAKIDPRIIPSAPFMDAMSYGDMLGLAENGAKVIHPRAVAMGQHFGIPIRIRSTFSEGEGTLISANALETNDKVIGLALEKGDIESKLFVLFDGKRINDIKQDMDSFVESLDWKTQDIIWTENSFIMMMPTLKSIEIVKKLYETLV